MNKKTQHKQKGFMLVEALVSVGVFVVMVVTIYGIFSSMTQLITTYRERIVVAQLANQYMEIVHNLPYTEVGTLNGNPPGNLIDLPNATNVILNNNTYHIYYVVSYVDDPADGTILAETDPAPNDYKQVKLYVVNTSSGLTKSFVTNITPKGLEDMDAGGALVVKVFDAVGQPVSNATITITNTIVTPNINLTRTTDALGNWIEVGLPPSANSYHITATKNNYSSDQTYSTSVQNPNPIKADATIANGQVTQVSFSIDKLSSLTFKTLDQTCFPISDIGLQVRGSKLIGLPDIFKFQNTYLSNGSGQVVLNNLEWDIYTPVLSVPGYSVYGTSPIQQINILPETNQNFNLILGPSTPHSILVIVEDSLGNPLEGATVQLQRASSYDVTKTTGGSVWSQQDWSGGGGQVNFTDSSKYFSDDGNITNNLLPLGLRLFHNGLVYVGAGIVESSTFNSGTAITSYTTLTWDPPSQDPATSVKFQIASNNDNTTWNYLGPDGTGNTYYTVSGTTINAVHNTHQYARYKVFLSTTDGAKTPVLTSVNVNYVSGCFTPGQVIFTGLASGGGYDLSISLPGYQTQQINSLNIDGYDVLSVSLVP